MKNVKKVFLTLTALSIVACSASAFFACSEHEHEWSDWTVTAEATCDTAGQKERVCAGDVSHKETETVPALGHDWGEWADKSAADCTNAKTQERTCGNNPDHKETRTAGEPDSAAHKWGEWTLKTAADCENAKVEERVCQYNAGHTETRTAGEPDAGTHKWGEWQDKTGATCVSGKTQERTCEHDARHRQTRTVGEPDSSAHNWGEWTDKTDATCSSGKLQERICGHDAQHKETRTVGESDTAAHKWGGWEEKTPADCTHAKVEERVCEHNPEHAETRAVGEPLGHTMTFTAATPADCTNDGVVEHWTCSVCHKDFADENGKTELASTVDPKKGHTMTHTAATPANCTEDGVLEHWTCTVCGKHFADENGETELTSTVDPKKGHAMTHTEAVSAGCTKDGVVEHWTCSVCKKDFADEDGNTQLANTVVPAAHTPVYQSEEEAGCTWNGRRAYYSCEVCEKTFLDEECTQEFTDLEELVIPAEHKLTVVAEKAKSKVCTKPDNSSVTYYSMAYYECETCGKIFKDEEAQNEVTSVYYNTMYRGFLVDLGDNLVDCTGVSGFSGGGINYIANKKGQYTFTCDKGATISLIAYILDGTGAKAPVYQKSAWVTDSNAYSKFVVNDADQPLTNSVTVNMEEGEWIMISLSVPKFTVSIETASVLFYGENSVVVTEANAAGATSVDKYTFTSDADKAYSITVPEGMVVLMNDQELITEGTWANFEAKANEPVTFTFINDTAKTYSVTIGDEKSLPKLSLANNSSNTLTLSVSSRPSGADNGPAVAEVDVEEEATYKVTVKLSNNLGTAYTFFGKNISGNYFEFSGMASNGNFSFSPYTGKAEVVYGQMQANCYNGATYTTTAGRGTFTVTLTLKKGDKLMFAHTGATNGTVDLSLVKV